MPGADTLDFQRFSTVLGHDVIPRTLASANVIAPVSFLTILTGNTVVKTITPPMTSVHTLAIVFAGVNGVDATGNINTAKASVAGEAMLLIYDPISSKYYPVG